MLRQMCKWRIESRPVCEVRLAVIVGVKEKGVISKVTGGCPAL